MKIENKITSDQLIVALFTAAVTSMLTVGIAGYCGLLDAPSPKPQSKIVKLKP